MLSVQEASLNRSWGLTPSLQSTSLGRQTSQVRNFTKSADACSCRFTAVSCSRRFDASYFTCLLSDAGKLACLDALLCSILGSTDRVVVVSNSTATLDIIQAHCRDNGWESCRLDGSTDANKRQVSTSCPFHKMLSAHASSSSRLQGAIHHVELLLAYPD